MKIDLKAIFLAGVLSQLLSVSVSYADIHLSVNPIRGGNTIQFGRVNRQLETNQEVRIRVNATGGTQYQVFERLIEPLLNEKGMGLPMNVIENYTLPGSNAAGTLYLQSPTNLSQAEELIYSSSPQGNSDNFTIVYSLKPERVDSDGTFLGRIQYVVRAVGSPERDEVILTVNLDAASEFDINIEGTPVKDRIKLRYPDNLNDKASIKIDFKGNTDGDLKIYQEPEAMPQNDGFHEIGAGVIKFLTSGSSNGGIGQTNFERKRELIYSSDTTEDSFLLNFFIDPAVIKDQKAGTYRTRVKYTVETGKDRKEFWLDLEVEIAALFKMDIEYPPEGMHFNNLLPDGPPMFKTVIVRVNSNLGKPYSVIQNVQATLTNQKGEEMPKEHFVQKVELVGSTDAKTAITDFTPVNLGEKTLYTSSQGDSAEFKVIYRLQPFAEMTAGEYSASIVYSLGEN